MNLIGISSPAKSTYKRQKNTKSKEPNKTDLAKKTKSKDTNKHEIRAHNNPLVEVFCV